MYINCACAPATLANSLIDIPIVPAEPGFLCNKITWEGLKVRVGVIHAPAPPNWCIMRGSVLFPWLGSTEPVFSLIGIPSASTLVAVVEFTPTKQYESRDSRSGFPSIPTCSLCSVALTRTSTCCSVFSHPLLGRLFLKISSFETAGLPFALVWFPVSRY